MYKTMLIVLILVSFTFMHAQEKTNPLLKENNFSEFLIIAHRGACAYAPENTLPAFEKGIKMGANMFELDVHLTKDEKLIVVHDDDLVRCSDVKAKFPDRAPYLVSDFTLEEIRQLDAGSWFIKELEKPAAKRGRSLGLITNKEKEKYIPQKDFDYYKSGLVKHPTLKEALLLGKKYDVFVNVEIKAVPRFYPNIAEKVVKLIKELDMVDKVIISSFDHYQVVWCKNLEPKLATAILCGDRIYNIKEYCKLTKADACNFGNYVLGTYSVTFQNEGKLLSLPLKEAVKEGISVNVWTVNSKREMKVLIKEGVKGIFSDYPNRLIEVLKEKK